MDNFIQAYISNVSFSKTFEEILKKYTNNLEITTLDPILYEDSVEWTAPKWVKKDDVVFFMFSKTSIDTIHHLKKEFRKHFSMFSFDEQNLITNSLIQGEELYKKYGGSIFAIGKVSGNLSKNNFASEEDYHWKGRVYAPINDIFILKDPVHISEFNSFIMVSRQSSITPLFGLSFDKLKDIIISKNSEISYLVNAKACPLPLAQINSDNWYEVSNQYRRSFFLEYQFRAFFVDYLLPLISDTKKVYKECPCIKNQKPTTFVDNLISINERFLPVEVKLNISTEKDLESQCKQYCSLDKMYFQKVNGKEVPIEKLYRTNVLVIDTNGIYIYSERNDLLRNLVDFDSYNCLEKKNELIELIKNSCDLD